MSPQKLLELALLDASGVLDPAESAEFERCFAEADADLKAQVRREQARFADVSEDDFNIDPDSIRDRISERTRVLMPVHLFGQIADMNQIA
ncbi:MAG: DegT/DnrJ/EryC1/StrS family aminotransferase, partial [Planctomycetota bacterium]